MLQIFILMEKVLRKFDGIYYRNHRDYKNAEIRKACMAECVVKECVPVSDFAYIYVYSEKAKEKILKMENAAAIKDRIQVMPSMFPVSR